jgi:hypothetical protein
MKLVWYGNFEGIVSCQLLLDSRWAIPLYKFLGMVIEFERIMNL